MSKPLLIRNSPVGKLVPAVMPLLIAAIFAFFALRGLDSGASGARVALAGLIALACAAFGLVLGRGAFDRTVQVILDESGFRDRRVGDVVVPWDRVARVTVYEGDTDSGPSMVHFELTGPPPEAIRTATLNLVRSALTQRPNTVTIEISSLDVTGQQVREAIRRLAPHVPVG